VRIMLKSKIHPARFDTYAIKGETGSGEICLHGAAARMACPNDLVIIMTYCHLGEGETYGHQPKIVHVDGGNRIVEKSNETIFV